MAQADSPTFSDAGQPSPPNPYPGQNPAQGSAAEAGSVPVNASPAQLRSIPPHHAASGVPIQCQFCVGQRFRRSRLRAADIKHLLLMRYPVRCLFCNQRQMVSFTVAGVSLPSHVSQPEHRKRSSRKN